MRIFFPPFFFYYYFFFFLMIRQHVFVDGDFNNTSSPIIIVVMFTIIIIIIIIVVGLVQRAFSKSLRKSPPSERERQPRELLQYTRMLQQRWLRIKKTANKYRGVVGRLIDFFFRYYSVTLREVNVY
jgi:hypothetical protein